MNNNNHKFSATAGMGLPIARNFAILAGTEGQYIPFSGTGIGIEVKNNYPQILANLAANAPTHGAALQKKHKLTFGQGIDFEGMSENLYNQMQNLNQDMETINDILDKVSNDLVTYGGYALKVSWTFDKQIYEIEHVPFKYVRLGRPVNGKIHYYTVCNDWEMKLNRELRWEYSIPKFNPNKINSESAKIIDGKMRADEITEENASQLIYFKSYSTASDGYYPLPDYVSGLDSAFTEVEVGVSMLKGIENGINGAYIVSTGDTIIDDDSKQEVIDTFNELATGAANTGGLIFMPTNVQVDALEAIPADTYEAINPEIRQRIITAHGIPSILLEYSQGGGFNNRAEEYIVALEQFQLTVIKSYQNQIIRQFNSILSYMTSDDFTLSIIPFIQEETVVSNTIGDGDTTITTNDITINDESSLQSE